MKQFLTTYQQFQLVFLPKKENTKKLILQPAFRFAISILLFSFFAITNLAAQDFSAVDTACPFDVAAAISEPTCRGTDDGSIMLQIASTIDTPVDIKWLDLPTGANITDLADNLPAGIYKCMLSGGACVDTLSFVVADPPELLAVSNKEVVCDKATAIKLFESVTGGRPPYRYSYVSTNDVVPNCLDCDTDEIVVDKTTDFQVTVKDTKGCQTIQNITIIVAPDIDFVPTVEPVKCFGEENALLEVSSNVAGNIVSYSLVGTNDIELVQDNPSFSGLAAGAYQVIAEDAYGCTQEKNIVISQPEELRIESLDISPVSCPGEKDAGVIVAARGGNANYQYAIDGENFRNTNIFRNLAAGNYNLLVKDNKECTTESSFSIAEKPTPALEIKTQDISCPDENDGSFIVIIETIEGFYDNYEYSLDNEVFQGDSIFTKLEPGTYDLFARSNTGCTFQQSVNIAPAPNPDIDFQIETPSCPDEEDGSFIVIIETIEGFYNDYDYSIDGVEFQKDSLFENLAAGFYEVTTRTNTGCSFQQTIEIQAPTKPDITIQSQNVTCPDANDGSFIVIIETIEGFYQYSIDGERFQKDSIFKELPAGDYTLSIRNENNCIVTKEITITEPTAPQIEIEVQNESCAGDNNGQITINTTGGVEPFQYSINNGVTFQNENVFTNLTPGIYTVIVKDANGCTFEKLINISAAESLQAEFTINHATCNYDNGFIASIVTGGHFPYSYNWSGVSTNEAVAKKLFAGTYSLTITDASNCQWIQENLEVLNENVPILNAAIRAANCNGENNGAIDLEVESNAHPLKYKWSNGSTTKNISNLKADAYAVTVVDANQCSESKIYEVEEPEAIQIDLELTQKLGKGFITAEVTGGVGSYRFLWSTGSKENKIENLPTGNYSVTIVDDNSCTETIDIDFVIQVVKDIKDHIAFYPNPTNGDLTIDFNFPEEQMISYELIDELGRILLKKQIEGITKEKKTLDLQNFPSAVYFLRINIGNDSIVGKVLKINE